VCECWSEGVVMDSLTLTLIILGVVSMIVSIRGFIIFCIHHIVGDRARVALYCMMWRAWKGLSPLVEGIKRVFVRLGCLVVWDFRILVRNFFK